MAWMKLTVVLTILLGLCAANTINRDTAVKTESLEQMIKEVRTSCEGDSEPLACMKLRAMKFLDIVFNKDNFKLSDDIEVRANGPTEEARSQTDFMGFVENYLRLHDVSFKVPAVNSEVTVSSRNINSDEVDIKFKFLDGESRGLEESKSRRNKMMKRLMIPIIVLILLKSMTVIPLALGILGLKAFNALQLGFMAFLVSGGLVIFQICKKLAIDHHHVPHVVPHHGVHWDGRSLGPKDDDSHNLVYSAYAQD